MIDALAVLIVGGALVALFAWLEERDWEAINGGDDDNQ